MKKYIVIEETSETIKIVCETEKVYNLLPKYQDKYQYQTYKLIKDINKLENKICNWGERFLILKPDGEIFITTHRISRLKRLENDGYIYYELINLIDEMILLRKNTKYLLTCFTDKYYKNYIEKTASNAKDILQIRKEIIENINTNEDLLEDTKKLLIDDIMIFKLANKGD